MDTAPQHARRSIREAAVYPTLTMIDAARGPKASQFATDLHASELETLARSLSDEYWSEGVWLTGLIAPSQLHAVTSRLETRRTELRASVRVLVAEARVPRVAFLHPGETYPIGMTS